MEPASERARRAESGRGRFLSQGMRLRKGESDRAVYESVSFRHAGVSVPKGRMGEPGSGGSLCRLCGEGVPGIRKRDQVLVYFQ